MLFLLTNIYKKNILFLIILVTMYYLYMTDYKKKLGFRSLFRKCVAHTISKESQPKMCYINELRHSQ